MLRPIRSRRSLPGCPRLLGYFIAVGPAATDMYLPAFPAVEASFGTAPGTAQLTLAAWFAGLAVGQITQGTLSDRFGRRIPLIAGTAVFTLACIGCALAPSLTWLAIFRVFGAIGASAGMVVPRAVVRDLAEGSSAAVLMSRLMLVMGVAPILAPTIGGAVLAFAHWRVIFWILALYGAIGCVMAWRLLPETLPPARRTHLGLAKQLARYAGILRERGFLSHAAMGAAGSFCMFAYLAGSSPVFIQGFGLTPQEFGLIFGFNSCGLIAGSQINRRFLPRFGLSFMLRLISRMSLAATATLAAVVVRRRAQHVGDRRADLCRAELPGLQQRQHHGRRAVAACAARRQRFGADGHGAVLASARPAGCWWGC